MSANRTPLSSELCVFCRLGPYQAAIDAICLFDDRICRRRIAIATVRGNAQSVTQAGRPSS